MGRVEKVASGRVKVWIVTKNLSQHEHNRDRIEREIVEVFTDEQAADRFVLALGPIDIAGTYYVVPSCRFYFVGRDCYEISEFDVVE